MNYIAEGALQNTYCYLLVIQNECLILLIRDTSQCCPLFAVSVVSLANSFLNYLYVLSFTEVIEGIYVLLASRRICLLFGNGKKVKRKPPWYKNKFYYIPCLPQLHIIEGCYSLWGLTICAFHDGYVGYMYMTISPVPESLWSSREIGKDENRQ